MDLTILSYLNWGFSCSSKYQTLLEKLEAASHHAAGVMWVSSGAVSWFCKAATMMRKEDHGDEGEELVDQEPGHKQGTHSVHTPAHTQCQVARDTHWNGVTFDLAMVGFWLFDVVASAAAISPKTFSLPPALISGKAFWFQQLRIPEENF